MNIYKWDLWTTGTRSRCYYCIIVKIVLQWTQASNKHMRLCVSAWLKTRENKYCEDTWCNSTAFNLKKKKTNPE